MPTIKPKRDKKMLKLKDFNELATVNLAVPEAAFAPKPELQVPTEAFNNPKKPMRGEHPAYIYRLLHKRTKIEYVVFTFLNSTLKKHFRKHVKGDLFELVQGAAPHQHWFMLRKPLGTRGNKSLGAGAVFHTKTFVDPKLLEHGVRYPLELVFKEGALYAVLPQELVSKLHKG